MPEVGWVRVDTGIHGGAEIADEAMMSKCPANYTELSPAAWKDFFNFDRLVLSSTRSLSGKALDALCAHPNLTVWLHHAADHTPSEANLFHAAKNIVVLSDVHRKQVGYQLYDEKFSLNCGWFDTTGIEPAAVKTTEALWAHRFIWHKGLDLATDWAEKNGLELRVCFNQPREVALARMAEAKRFVLLSKILDPAPLAVMEAILAGCEPITNDLVGVVEKDPDALRKTIDTNAERFWETVCA